jgi:hypothetical protein
MQTELLGTSINQQHLSSHTSHHVKILPHSSQDLIAVRTTSINKHAMFILLP